MTRKKVKARDKVSKKLLVKLFEEGKVPTDPEVKELGYKSTTVHNYYLTWRSKGEVSVGETKLKVTKVAKLETPLPGGESMSGIDETKLPPPSEGKEAEAGPEEGEGVPELPRLVKGGGIEVKTELSVKTLAYYQLAATVAGNNLRLGDFLDYVTEDFFTGRGQSLGLVKIKGSPYLRTQ